MQLSVCIYDIIITSCNPGFSLRQVTCFENQAAEYEQERQTTTLELADLRNQLDCLQQTVEFREINEAHLEGALQVSEADVAKLKEELKVGL
jgi:hypothetical protein